jgi:chromosomal replication initiator protein
MYLARQLTSRALPEIGCRFGDRNHTTVLHAIRKIKSMMTETPPFAEEISALRRDLLARHLQAA